MLKLKRVSRFDSVFLSELDLEKRWGGFVLASTLKNWRCQNKGPVYTKLGNIVVYHIDDVVAYEKEHRIIPGRSIKDA